MSNILILVDRYLPNASSNGVCARNIVNELMKMGYHPIILDIDNDSDFTNHYSLSYGPRAISMKSKLVGYTQDSRLVNLLYTKAKELHIKYKFVFVLTFFRPIETIICGERLKNEQKIIHIPCFLDLPETAYSSSIKKILAHMNYRRLFKKLLFDGKIITLKYYQKYFQKSIGRRNFPKLRFTGIPNLVKHNLNMTSIMPEGYINIVYTGSFSENFRNPDKMLSYLLQVIKGEKIKLHLFSWGCEEIIHSYKDVYNNQLEIHSRVSFREAHQAISGASVLINLANDVSLQVPGKMIEYLSSGKPVIYFQTSKADISIAEFSEYPEIFIIRLFEDDYYRKEKCLSFIKKNENCEIDFDKISTLFGDHSPKKFVEEIIEIIGKR